MLLVLLLMSDELAFIELVLALMLLVFSVIEMLSANSVVVKASSSKNIDFIIVSNLIKEICIVLLVISFYDF